MKLTVFLTHLEGGIFKLIPLWEAQMDGQDVHLDLYIHDLIDEMLGAQVTFPKLADDGRYISIINILQYMATHECSFAACKRRVFKMLGILNEMGGLRHHV